MTSRAPKETEQDGREYYFWRKEHVLQKIREKEMVEWGELDNQLYGEACLLVYLLLFTLLLFTPARPLAGSRQRGGARGPAAVHVEQ